MHACHHWPRQPGSGCGLPCLPPQVGHYPAQVASNSSPLVEAAASGSVELVQHLLGHKADPSVLAVRPAREAVWEGG